MILAPGAFPSALPNLTGQIACEDVADTLVISVTADPFILAAVIVKLPTCEDSLATSFSGWNCWAVHSCPLKCSTRIFQNLFHPGARTRSISGLDRCCHFDVEISSVAFRRLRHQVMFCASEEYLGYHCC